MTEMVTGLVIAFIFLLGYFWGRLMGPSRNYQRQLIAENNRLKAQLARLLMENPLPDPSKDAKR